MANETSRDPDGQARRFKPSLLDRSTIAEGGVAYRMAFDHSKNVERLAVFEHDSDVWRRMERRSDARFAQTFVLWMGVVAREDSGSIRK